jgi:transcriptional regulator with GAF, ATPase, and Fis domain
VPRLHRGESGTGKELIAGAVHALSPRRDRPFIELNCAAIPSELIESEMFGHVKGAFTGAVSDRKGKFEAATTGTLFLDEIGDMSLITQAKLLRVLQEGIVTPVGSSEPRAVDVRIVSATSKNLPEEIARGTFREDLYHRINVLTVAVPPLRNRREDIPELAEHFLRLASVENDVKPKRLSPRAVDLLIQMPWQGTCGSCATSWRGSSCSWPRTSWGSRRSWTSSRCQASARRRRTRSRCARPGPDSSASTSSTASRRTAETSATPPVNSESSGRTSIGR